MPTDSGHSPAGDDLSSTVEQLRQEVRELQARVRSLETGLPRTSVLAAAAERAPVDRAAVQRAPVDRRLSGLLDRRQGRDMEALVGRYGTIGLGALLLVMAAGVLLSWAVQRFQFGPTGRVVLGAIGAAVVAGVGLRLRRHGTRSFGSALLAIALALVHVDAWGAGPSLGVIPNWAALVIAAAASVALAALAWTADEEVLFVVGVGGAFLAPFVAADKHADLLLLLAYGWVVFASALMALRGRPWRIATRVLAIAIGAYTTAAMAGDWGGATRTIHDAPAFFALVCAATVLGVRAAPSSRALIRAYIWIAVVAVLVRAFRPENAHDVIVFAAAGVLITYLAEHREGGALREWLATSIGAPLALLAIIAALPQWGYTPERVAVALAWSVAAAIAARLSKSLTGAHLYVSAAASGYAVVAVTHLVAADATTAQLLATAGLVVHAVAYGAFARRRSDALTLLAPTIGLILSSWWAYDLLMRRAAFAYAPFLTWPSLAAFVVVAGWVALTMHARTMPEADESEPHPATIVGSLAAVSAFLWGREELVRAFSSDVAIFLVILYFAAAGITAILAGRAHNLALARRAGLAVAVYAALKALYQASDLDSVGLRIGAYVLVGSFLLGVAFVYRGAERTDIAESAPVPQA